MLYQYLKEQMLKYPNKTLLEDGHSITYNQLLEEAEEMGKGFCKHKYGILCKSGLNTAKAVMACLSAGKTAVLLSLRYGEKHYKKITELCQLSYIITEDRVIQISSPTEEAEDLSDVSFILCTSGTTGIPKGAMITSENLIANLSDIGKYFRITHKDRILITRPLYHCAVLTGEFLISLINGLDIVFDGGEFNPPRLLREIREKQITVTGSTPTSFYYLCNIVNRSSKKIDLRSAVVSGECMTPVVAKCMRDAMPDTDIYHVYGLTEASPRVSYLSPELFDTYPTSVGRPLASLQAKIVENELMIKGKSVMKGYYRNPQATQAAFSDGWLRTGDIVQMNEKGFLYIKSRKDDMIIRGGMNIYPQEIENALRQKRFIEDLMAYGKRDGKVGQKIHLDVVSESLSKMDVMKLCKEHLSPYQYPDEIHFVPNIPKNASGKVIRTRNGEA